ncbi:MAG: hypothetical protein CMB80_34725, partial [Flammeovirgaceae bacterium]|nr:hypothetical protein [Flammeovirgaceae bacterium]
MVKISSICAVIIVLVSFCKPLATKRDRYFTEVQQVETEEIFVPQNGSSSSIYFNRFDTQGGTRVLRGVEFFVQNNKRLFHGIEVLDNYPFYWNCIGLELDYTCDCENP